MSSRKGPSRPNNNSSNRLVFEDGAIQFRQRLVVSLLSHRPLLIRNIRSQDLESPGLQQHEASFLRLIDRMTNGSRIEINSTGTQLSFRPGVLLGGRMEHDCPVLLSEDDDYDITTTDNYKIRSIGWFLEGILPLAPFGKEPLHLTFRGITDGLCHMDPSPDYLQAILMPMLSHFGIPVDGDANDPLSSSFEKAQIHVVRRGGPPCGGGCVEFTFPLIRELTPIDWTDMGKIKRVRGHAISCKVVSSSLASRLSYSAKGLLQRLLPDIWITTDVHSTKRNACGPNPALSLVLAAESTSGVSLVAETSFEKGKELPEDVGKRGAALLLEEVRKGGVVDTHAQSLVLLWMCLTPEDVSRIRLGTLSQYTIQSLRLFRQALGVEFKIKPDHETKTVLLSCFGTGYRNMARAST